MEAISFLVGTSVLLYVKVDCKNQNSVQWKIIFYFLLSGWYSRSDIGLNCSNCEQNVKRGMEHHVWSEFRSGSHQPKWHI